MNPIDRNKISELAEKWLKGTASSREKTFLDDWYKHDRPDAPIWKKPETETELEQRLWLAIDGHSGKKYRLKPFLKAAAIFALITLGLGFYYHQSNVNISSNELVSKTDVNPAGNNAILILSNGKEVVLAEDVDKISIRDKNTSITQTASGKIVYNAKNDASNEILYNTISTPKGGRYEVLLSDGSLAILDAGSSLTYPTVFKGRERKVRMSGQVYFTVAHDVNKPFRVIARQQVVEDLGTEFNIKAYEDETNVQTTLVSGLAKVSTPLSSVLLKPREKSSVNNQNNQLTKGKADLNQDIAWRHGQFRFKDRSIESIMNELARWYNIEVEYVGDKPEDEFNGKISRYKNLSQVLKVLQTTNRVKFKIDGRRVTVMK